MVESWLDYLFKWFDWQRMWLDISTLSLLSTDRNLTGQEATYNWAKIKCVWLQLGQTYSVQSWGQSPVFGGRNGGGSVHFKRKWSDHFFFPMEEESFCYWSSPIFTLTACWRRNHLSRVLILSLKVCTGHFPLKWIEMHAVNSFTPLKYRDYGL